VLLNILEEDRVPVGGAHRRHVGAPVDQEIDLIDDLGREPAALSRGMLRRVAATAAVALAVRSSLCAKDGLVARRAAIGTGRSLVGAAHSHVFIVLTLCNLDNRRALRGLGNLIVDSGLGSHRLSEGMAELS
jgi:hypothetical protein